MFFNKPLLSKKRKSALENFRKQAVSALEDLGKKTNDPTSKEIYNRMINIIEKTPIVFYPKRSLKEKIFTVKGRVFGSVVKGEHVNVISIFQKGGQRFFVKSNYINLPAYHVFEGDELSIDGIFTLSHEYAHFPKPSLGRFAKANGMFPDQAEELLADVLAAKLAVKMGYPKELAMTHFAGREIVYGKIPFRKFIWSAINK